MRCGLAEETRSSIDVKCAVDKESMETARSSLEKLAPKSGETLTRRQLRCIPELHFEPLTRQEQVVDTEVLVSQDY